jgi:hypothetical protein
MKKFLFFISAVFFLVGCSTDDRELEDSKMEIEEVNATYLSDGCSITTFDFSTLGKIEVRNDRDYLYVSISAYGENTLASTSLHLASSFSGFPVKGKGNLQPQAMEFQESFEAGVYYHNFKFPVDKYGANPVIASYTTFGDLTSVWAGDIAVRQGNWAYFNHEITEHPVNAGPDNSATITLSEARALPSWDEVRKVYAGMLAPGVPKKEGTYNPSIWELINDFNDPKRETQLGEYTTTYTLGKGDCTDSVILTMIVVPDEESL